MRKLIILSAAVVLGGWAMSGTAAKAELGCLCTNMGKAACVSGITACFPSSGVCVLPCDYTPAKKAKMSKRPAKKKG
jgi:hypothetical protein